MDFFRLAEQLKRHKCVLGVAVCDDYVEATIRSKIMYYDEQLVNWILRKTAWPEWKKKILQNLSKYEQEHRFRVNKDRVKLVNHEPVTAFGSPFVDLGYWVHEMQAAIARCDYENLVDTMVCEVQSIDVSDVALMEQFFQYAPLSTAGLLEENDS